MFRCHQCFGIVEVEDVAHVDLYADLCWIQCEQCAHAWGDQCGADRKVNPHPHGYFACPLRVDPPREPAPRGAYLRLVGDQDLAG